MVSTLISIVVQVHPSTRSLCLRSIDEVLPSTSGGCNQTNDSCGEGFVIDVLGRRPNEALQPGPLGCAKPVEPNSFLSLVYEHLRSTGAWPTVRALQVQLRAEGDVRLLAARAGPDRIVCNYGSEPLCFLTLRGLADLPSANGDLQNVLAVLRFLARRCVVPGNSPITSTSLAHEVNLSSSEVARVGTILYHDHSTWAGWSGDQDKFELTPRDDTIFFENVQSVADVLQIRARIASESMEAARLTNRRARVAPVVQASRVIAEPARGLEWPRRVWERWGREIVVGTVVTVVGGLILALLLSAA